MFGQCYLAVVWRLHCVEEPAFVFEDVRHFLSQTKVIHLGILFMTSKNSPHKANGISFFSKWLQSVAFCQVLGFQVTSGTITGKAPASDGKPSFNPRLRAC